MELEPEKIDIFNKLDKDALEFINLTNRSEDLIKEMTNKIQVQRGNLINNKLKELDIDIDFKAEQHRRFKRICIEYRDNEETVYYNDGSKQGLRVITFITEQIPFDYDKISIGYTTKYY